MYNSARVPYSDAPRDAMFYQLIWILVFDFIMTILYHSTIKLIIYGVFVLGFSFYSTMSVAILYNMATVFVLVQWFLFQFVIFSWCPERFISFRIPVSGGFRKLTRMIKYLLIYYYSS